MDPLPASLSLVIEWENAGRIGCTRAAAMLGALRLQLDEPALVSIGRIEILFVHPAGSAAPDTIAELTAAGHPWPAELRLISAPTDDYYQQKNHGAACARGDLVVFLDSDVIPQAGWLTNLVAPFASPDIEVVGGTTFLDRRGLYSAAMALGWIFPLPPEESGLMIAPAFYANNVAFRRALFERHPFPRTNQYRGQCGVLAETLRENGIVIHINRSAAVSHPPPEGFAGFVRRALWSGHDSACRFGRRGAYMLPAQHLQALGRVLKHRRRVGLGPVGTIGAAGIVAGYHVLRYAGFLAAALAPAATRRRLWSAERRHARGAREAGQTRALAGEPG